MPQFLSNRQIKIILNVSQFFSTDRWPKMTGPTRLQSGGHRRCVVVAVVLVIATLSTTNAFNHNGPLCKYIYYKIFESLLAQHLTRRLFQIYVFPTPCARVERCTFVWTLLLPFPLAPRKQLGLSRQGGLNTRELDSFLPFAFCTSSSNTWLCVARTIHTNWYHSFYKYSN